MIRERDPVGGVLHNAPASSPSKKLIHEIFEEAVALYPDNIAVEYGTLTLTYQELNHKANRLAHHLLARGIAPDDPVVTFLDRTPELIIALMGILKAGGAYVPLDTSFPPKRIDHVLAETEARAVIANKAHKETLAGKDVPVFDIESIVEAPGKPGNIAAADIGLGSRNLAYVIYTSGSTGLPKGVMIEHASVVNYLNWRHAFFQTVPGDVFVQKAPVTFDLSIAEMILPVTAGAKLVISRADKVQDLADLSRIIESRGVTRISLVPSLLAALLPMWSRFPSLKDVVCGGDILTPGLVERFHSIAGKSCALHNLYGPAEATFVVSCHSCTNRKYAAVPIGRPVANTRFHILDACKNPVPAGDRGELYIGGDCLARGYLGKPDLTAESFVENLFGSGRLYRTGDWVRRLANGELEFIGRIDNQVKIRGVRIELEEIERRLNGHPRIRESAVTVCPGGQDDRRLVAHCVPVIDAPLDVRELREYLKKSLPGYLVPSGFVRTAAIPLTANGKIDRGALSAPSEEAFARGDDEAPRGRGEVLLLGIWKRLFGIARIGINDDFIDLGGHSLLAFQVVLEIQKNSGKVVGVQDIFKHPTIKELAAYLEGKDARAAAALKPAFEGECLALSSSQRGMWFIQQMGGGRAYTIPVTVNLRGELDIAALELAMRAVIERHEILRTTFHVQDGNGVPRISSAIDFRLSREDFSCLPSSEADHALRRLTRLENAHEFDLARGPLLRARLVTLSSLHHLLKVTLHHMVCDGWSIRILLKEIAEFYAAQIEQRDHRLPPLPIQYADYASRQSRWLEEESAASHVEYWKARLSRCPQLISLPLDRPRGGFAGFNGRNVRVQFDGPAVGRMQERALAAGVTSFMFFYACYAVLLSKVSGDKDLIIGVPVANRDRAETEGLIGPFVNTLPLRLSLRNSMSVGDLLSSVKETVLEAFAHQGLPFERIVHSVEPDRDFSHNPLFQVMLALQQEPGMQMRLPGVSLEWAGEDFDEASQFDLTLTILLAKGRAIANLNYSNDLFDEAKMTRWLDGYRNIANRLGEDMDARIGDFQ